MLLAINWCYWQEGKNHACVWRFKIASWERTSLKPTRFSQTNKHGFFSNRPLTPSLFMYLFLVLFYAIFGWDLWTLLIVGQRRRTNFVSVNICGLSNFSLQVGTDLWVYLVNTGNLEEEAHFNELFKNISLILRFWYRYILAILILHYHVTMENHSDGPLERKLFNNVKYI